MKNANKGTTTFFVLSVMHMCTEYELSRERTS